jgi:hypothetical protein
MCQNVPNKHHLIPEEDLENQTVFVSAYVDDDKLVH